MSNFLDYLDWRGDLPLARDAFNEVQESGSNRDFGTTKAAKMYFSLSNPGPNTFAGNEVKAPQFAR